MDITPPAVCRYAELHTSAASLLLQKIERETVADISGSNMMSGPLQGRLLAMISRLKRPKAILEIGSYTGYSALCLAEGLTLDGLLITIDIDSRLEGRVRGYFSEAGALGARIDYRIGDARQIIPLLDMHFDLVWIDADKKSYPSYYDMVIDKMSVDGYILADNILWKGKVLEPSPGDDTTQCLDAFNRKVNEDDRVENVLLPIRDGIMMMRRK